MRSKLLTRDSSMIYEQIDQQYDFSKTIKSAAKWFTDSPSSDKVESSFSVMVLFWTNVQNIYQQPHWLAYEFIQGPPLTSLAGAENTDLPWYKVLPTASCLHKPSHLTCTMLRIKREHWRWVLLLIKRSHQHPRRFNSWHAVLIT